MTQPAIAPAPLSLSQTVDVETPELVVLSYTIAGAGSRAYAALIDYLICFVAFLAVVLGISTFTHEGTRELPRDPSVAWAVAVIIIVQFVLLWGYYVLFEALADGQTPGKRLHRLRVVRDGGFSVTFGASAIRNLVRFVDMQPGLLYGVGVTSVIISKTGKRLGDMAAGTIVVREAVVRQPAVPTPAARALDDGEPPALNTALSEDEFTLLERFVQRAPDFDSARRTAFAEQFAQRFAPHFDPADGRSNFARLKSLYDSDRLARAQGVAARRDTGAARERHAIIAAGSVRWAHFATRLTTAQQRGLQGLGEDGVREFVQEYRELTADLARLRTAARGREAGEVFYLNRLVSGAHNLLYRRRTLPLRDILDYLFAEVPREIRASATPILLAAGLMFGPAAIAYTGVVRNPELAAAFLPPQMLDRAEDGVNRARTEEGYIPDPQILRPVMASNIITNNVQVAFGAFAFGITAGILTTWLLIANGISIGAVFGLYASKGIAGLLLAFVAPHGVLELTAICIAGGAGFLLAAALLIPGARTRRTALIENGRRAITLVAGAGMLLVVAGTLEGFVSPIEWWPLQLKLAVSGVTVVALYVFLRLAPRARIDLPSP